MNPTPETETLKDLERLLDETGARVSTILATSARVLGVFDGWGDERGVIS